ncbi:NAC transcription factor ONAC010-like [Hibiscus syriacus]|uniref:NAC transcription factor ONAC010-like n=1 Tax=Hibiscus syriacus TaxID=106335 RepID=UPI001922DB01|nr:NAC transcription factor ONAC010-like [Hibiscus syriacus]
MKWDRIRIGSSAAVEGLEIFAHEGDEIASASEDFPVGFRFVPTDAELIENYLIKKLNDEHLPTNKNIHEVDLYGSTPSQITQQYQQSDGGEEWYFFTPRNRKYPNGKRSNRAAGTVSDTGNRRRTRNPLSVGVMRRSSATRETLIITKARIPTLDKWVLCKIYVARNKVKNNVHENGDPYACSTSQDVDGLSSRWVLCKIYVARNKVKNNVHENGDPYACSTSQDVDGLSSRADSSSQHVNRPPSMAINNNRGMANKVAKIAPLSSPRLRQTYAARNPYSTENSREVWKCLEACGRVWNPLKYFGDVWKLMEEYRRICKRFKIEDNVSHDGDMFKLTANNYSYWKPMIEDHLYCKDLHDPIIYKDKVEGKSDAQWELLNRMVVAMIHKYIDKTLFEHVYTYTNANELWTKLE